MMIPSARNWSKIVTCASVIVIALHGRAQAQVSCTTNADCTFLNDDCVVGFCNTTLAQFFCDQLPINEGNMCVDGDNCTVNDVCTAGVCGGTTVDCMSSSTECTTASCDPAGAEGNCGISTDVQNGTACDGLACVEDETCTAGACGGGTATDCSGLNTACATFECDPGADEGNCGDVTLENDGTTCTDGDACTLDETCQGGVCTPAADVDCSAMNTECRLFDCDPNGAVGNCAIVDNTSNQGVMCDAGGPCIVDELCDFGECVGMPVDCSGLSTDCVTVTCDVAGPEGNCDDMTNEPDGTVCGVDDPCLEAAGECAGGVCDAEPLDSDGDGTPDCIDNCPDDPQKTEPGNCGCGKPDEDTDGDGISDCVCPFQNTCQDDDDCAGASVCVPGLQPIGVCSCLDDGDCLTGDCLPTAPDGPSVCVTEFCGDLCPTDADKGAPGICGCFVDDVDDDGDGVFDCPCPHTPMPCVDNGDCGPDGTCLECGPGGNCNDADRVCVFDGGCGDWCPGDGGKLVPGICGCGFADTGDNDDDGVLDCADACPDDPEKSASAGQCGCGEPDMTYDVGGFVHFPNNLLAGVPEVTAQLFCSDFIYNEVVTTCDGGHLGQFTFENVPCGLCHLRLSYQESCDDHFDVWICGDTVAAGANENIPVLVNEANGTGVSPCLQNILATAYNGVYDLVGYNERCRADGGPCFANYPSLPLVPSLTALANCLFNTDDVATCCPAYADYGDTFDVDCVCRLDCNADAIFSIVSDLWCWSNCLISGMCQPGACPPHPTRAPQGFDGETIGGIIYLDEDDVLRSGVADVTVKVVDSEGYLYISQTDTLGVWAVDGLDAGVVTIHYSADRARHVVHVDTAKRSANQSLKWRMRGDLRSSPARLRR